jgi:hypothetical protein
MANKDKPISGLPAAGPLTGAELFATVQDGVTKYTTLQYINTSTTVNYGLFNQTGSSIPVTGSGTGVYSSGSLLDGGLGTLSVPANGFKVGDGFQALLTGKLEVANNHTLEIRVKTDNTVLADTGEITMAGTTDKNWRLEIDFSVNATGSAGTAAIATAGLFTYRKDASSDVQGEIFSFTNNIGFDTTITNTLVIEAILGTSCGTNEYIYSEYFTLRKTF